MGVDEAIKFVGQLKDVLDEFYDSCVRDLGGLDRAYNYLMRKREDISVGRLPLKIDVQNLSFSLPVNQHQHSLPRGIKSAELFLTVVVEFENDHYNFESVSRLNVDLEVNAISGSNRSTRSAWHLDYHIACGTENFSHPMYHFQFGGRKIRASVSNPNAHFDTGELNLMESPRLMHPPMDIVLAIDFVFSNYLGKDQWKRLRADPRFCSIIERVQSEMWRPYFEHLASHYSGGVEGEKAKLINPNF